jgi:4-hydroxyphenylpyruvate dioxygenase
MNFKLAMNTGTFSMHSADLPVMVQATSGTQFTGIELRDNHIHEFTQKGHSIQEIRELLLTHKLYPIAVHALRDWQELETRNRKEYRESLEQFIEKCKGIGCDCIACPAFAEDGDVQRDIRSFKEICDIGKGNDMRFAIEFLPWAELRDLGATWEVVRQADCSNGGILIDVFHFFKGGSRIEQLREVPTEKIFIVHLNDARDLPMDVKKMCMGHRLFPGQGVFPLGEFLDVLIGEKEYNGWFALEVFNEENQRIDYPELVNKGESTLQRLFSRYRK